VVSLLWVSKTIHNYDTDVIPYLRICEAGLMDIKKGKLVDLIVKYDIQKDYRKYFNMLDGVL